MATRPDYTVGSITLTAAQAEFATAGAALKDAAIQAGDQILLPEKGLLLTIAGITGQNTGVLTDVCPAAAAGATQPYRIRYQADGSRSSAQLQQLLEILSNKGFFRYDAAGKTADRAQYDGMSQGFAFLDVSTDPMRLYVKVSDTSGDWSSQIAYLQGASGASIELRNNAGVLEWRLAAQTPAAAWQTLLDVRAAASDEYSVSIKAAGGIVPASYPATRSARLAGTVTAVSLEMTAGAAGGAVDLYLAINGAMAWGPASVTYGGGLVSAAGLSITYAAGAQVGWVVSYSSGATAQAVLAQAVVELS